MKIMAFGNFSDSFLQEKIDVNEIIKKDYDLLILFGNFGKFSIFESLDDIMDKLKPLLFSTPIIVIPGSPDQFDNGFYLMHRFI